MWQTEDPREVIKGARARIVIARPSLCGRLWSYGSGDVETKHGWFIHTNFEDHPSIDSWDPDWYWALAPKES